MKDYRKYGDLYKYIGFFGLLIATFTFAYKITSWFIWAHRVIENAGL